MHWWGGELRALVPRGLIGNGVANGRRFVISLEGQRNRLLVERGGQQTVLAESPAASGIGDLAVLAKKHSTHPIGLRFGSSDFFARVLELPTQAQGDYGRILDLDMERATPFRMADVVTAHHVVPGVNAAPGKRAVRHLIVKRKTLDPLIAAMAERSLKPAFVDCWDETGVTAAPVDFLALKASGAGRGVGFTQAMSILAAGLAVSALLVVVVQHRQALENLEERTAAARVDASAIRQAIEQSQKAAQQVSEIGRLIRTRLPAAQILEELTSLLPDTAWVTDLRLDGDTIDFTGFAASAAALVPILENSPQFSDASLTSPVVLDNAEDKEKFSMRLRLTGRADIAPATMTSGANTGEKL